MAKKEEVNSFDSFQANSSFNTKSTDAQSKNKFFEHFKKPWVAILTIVGLIILLLIFNPFYIVDQTDVAVIKTFGSVTSVNGPGLHMKFPLIQSKDVYYVGIETINFVESLDTLENYYITEYPSITVLSTDGLEITIDLSVQAKLKQEMVMDIAKSFWGFDELENWRVAVIRGSVRDVLAKYSADALYGSQRSDIENQMRDNIREKLSKYFELNAVYVRKVTLPTNLQTTIEEKLQAQQESMKMEYVVEKEKQEADRKGIEAQGIANYNEIIAKSINKPFLEWSYVQAIDKMSSGQNSKVVLFPVSSSNIPGMSGIANIQTPSMILNTE